MDNKLRIRMPEDADSPCQLCYRRYLKAEAHWFCRVCRRSKDLAQCPENCQACKAMEEEEWRKRALVVAENKRRVAEKSKHRVNVNPFLVTSKYKRKKNKSSPPKIRAKPGPKPKINPEIKPRMKPGPKPKIKPPTETTGSGMSPVNPHKIRLKEFEKFLYADLNPTIPPHLAEPGFKLPAVRPHLKLKYDVNKFELMRLLASSSVCYHLSNNRTEFCDEDNQIFNAGSDGIVSLFASLIKFKANSLGKVIFQIREDLLSNVVCNDPDIVTEMIKGPINPKESFFGNFNSLKSAVESDPQNVLRRFQKRKPIVKKRKSCDSDFSLDGLDSSD